MIIDNLYVVEMISLYGETDTELIVDSNAVLSCPITMQSFKPIGWRDAQVRQTPCIVNHDQFSQSYSLNGLWKPLRKELVKNLFCFFVSKTFYHELIIHVERVYVKGVSSKIFPSGLKQ